MKKKEKDTRSIKPQIQNEDPIEGVKAVGCFFIGVVILIALASIAGYFINQIR